MKTHIFVYFLVSFMLWNFEKYNFGKKIRIFFFFFLIVFKKKTNKNGRPCTLGSVGAVQPNNFFFALMHIPAQKIGWRHFSEHPEVPISFSLTDAYGTDYSIYNVAAKSSLSTFITASRSYSDHLLLATSFILSNGSIEYQNVISSNFLFCISAFSWPCFSRTWWKTLTHQIWHELVHGGPRYGRMNT